MTVSHSAGGLLSGIVVGKLSDRFSPALIAIPAAILAAVTAVLQGTAQSLWMFGGMRSLHYFSAGGLDPAFQTLLSRFSPEEKRGTLFGLAYSMRMIGILLAALVSGGIIGLTGSIRPVFIAAGILFLLLLVPVFQIFPFLKSAAVSNRRKE